MRKPFAMTPETVGRFALPVTIGLFILLAHSLVRFGWNGLSLPTLVQPATIPAGAPPPTPSGAAIDYAAIADWHLFGEVDTTKPVPTVLTAAPETKLNLRLVGVFFAADETRAMALIAEGGGEERAYSVGNRLPGGARLTRILRDRIILSRDGVLETLSLPKESASLPTVGRPPQAPTDAPPVPPAADAAIVNASALANRLRGDAARRPDILQDLATASPYVQNGQFVGFRLSPGRDNRLLTQLGLHTGDIITEVNGTRLSSPSQALGLLRNQLDTDQVSVHVLRDGVEIPFTFNLNGANTPP